MCNCRGWWENNGFSLVCIERLNCGWLKYKYKLAKSTESDKKTEDLHVGWVVLFWSRKKISTSPSLCGCTVAWLEHNNRCVRGLVEKWSNLYSTALPEKQMMRRKQPLPLIINDLGIRWTEPGLKKVQTTAVFLSHKILWEHLEQETSLMVIICFLFQNNRKVLQSISYLTWFTRVQCTH